jgi:hypothetical protein
MTAWLPISVPVHECRLEHLDEVGVVGCKECGDRFFSPTHLARHAAAAVIKFAEARELVAKEKAMGAEDDKEDA